jgi:hypothetical protein
VCGQVVVVCDRFNPVCVCLGSVKSAGEIGSSLRTINMSDRSAEKFGTQTNGPAERNRRTPKFQPQCQRSRTMKILYKYGKGKQSNTHYVLNTVKVVNNHESN